MMILRYFDNVANCPKRAACIHADGARPVSTFAASRSIAVFDWIDHNFFFDSGKTLNPFSPPFVRRGLGVNGLAHKRPPGAVKTWS